MIILYINNLPFRSENHQESKLIMSFFIDKQYWC